MAESDTTPSALSLLKWPLLALLLGLAASAVFVGGSLTYLKLEQKNEKASLNALRDAEARIGNANKEISDLHSSLNIYDMMRRNGLFGEEDRLQWIERVAKLKQQYRIQDMEYELNPRQPVTLGASKTFPSLDIRGSRINMKFMAYHDAELLGFLGALASMPNGAYRMDNCLMKRIAIAPNVPAPPQLEATCGFSWVTLQDLKAPANPKSTSASTVPGKP